MLDEGGLWVLLLGCQHPAIADDVLLVRGFIQRGVQLRHVDGDLRADARTRQYVSPFLLVRPEENVSENFIRNVQFDSVAKVLEKKNFS